MMKVWLQTELSVLQTDGFFFNETVQEACDLSTGDVGKAEFG